MRWTRRLKGAWGEPSKSPVTLRPFTGPSQHPLTVHRVDQVPLNLRRPNYFHLHILTVRPVDPGVPSLLPQPEIVRDHAICLLQIDLHPAPAAHPVSRAGVRDAVSRHGV